MKRIQGLGIFLAACIAFAGAGCGNSPSQEAANADGKRPAGDNEESRSSHTGEDLSTPEKTIQAIKAADSSRDYDKFCRYFTQDAQQALAGGLLMSGKFLQAILNNPDNQDQISEEDQALVQAIDELLKKHGMDKKLDIQFDADPSEDQKVLQKVGEQMSDPCLFVTDFIKTLRAKGQNPDARMFEDDVHLENLTTVEGDRAEAELVFTRDEKEQRRPIGFQNVSGQWKISKIPDVLFK